MNAEANSNSADSEITSAFIVHPRGLYPPPIRLKCVALLTRPQPSAVGMPPRGVCCDHRDESRGPGVGY